MATSLPPLKGTEDKNAAPPTAPEKASVAAPPPRVKSVVATRREIADGVVESIEAAREGPDSWAYEQLMYKMKARDDMKRLRNQEAAKGQSFLRENAEQVQPNDSPATFDTTRSLCYVAFVEAFSVQLLSIGYLPLSFEHPIFARTPRRKAATFLPQNCTCSRSRVSGSACTPMPLPGDATRARRKASCRPTCARRCTGTWPSSGIEPSDNGCSTWRATTRPPSRAGGWGW